MEWTILIVLVLGLPISLAIWLLVRAVSAASAIGKLTTRIQSLEWEVAQIKRGVEPRPINPAREQKTAPTPVWTPPPPPAPEPGREPYAAAPVPERVAPPGRPMAVPPPIQASTAETPSKLKPGPQPAEASAGETAPTINWERFMGVKLFAWVGGLALFLGVAFFVKYSFDNNLVPPELRVAIGFLAGLGLLVGGVAMSRRDYAALSQTLCATGVVILYAVTFACRSIYHFEFFGPIPTFLIMVLITTTAFLLAVRLNAMVVAILGMLGGFLTPVLLSTGQDNPFGLFGYIAILDAGLIVVALHRRWFFLPALAAAGTAIMEIGWAASFFTRERYFEGGKILIALGVLLGFQVLYLAASWWAKARGTSSRWFWGSQLGLAAVALGFTAWFFSFAPLAHQPWLMFSFLFLIDLSVIALVWLEDDAAPAQPMTGLAVFGLLGFWTSAWLQNDLLNAALAFYFIFAILHSLLPVVLRRWRGQSGPVQSGQIFPPLALLLVLIPIFKLTELSFLVWPFVFLVDLLAIALAVISASALSVVVVLLLTLAATGALILKIPMNLAGLSTSLILLGAFSIFFVAAGVWLARRFKPGAARDGVPLGGNLAVPAELTAQLPSLSAILPFLLLMMATLRLPLANPSPVFGLALLLVVLLLGLARMFSLDWLPAIALGCIGALECAWHFNRFNPANPTQPLTWYLLFLAVFAAFPFLFRRRFADSIVPWAAAAMAGPLQFLLVYRLITAAYPNATMGLLPAAFALLPLLSLVVVLKAVPAEPPARMTQLAWFGGVALFFITLIFPIQFERQWITIGWALEGAALLWLFHRLPHPGLRLTGVGLLIIAFVRLAFNPAVLAYHARSAAPIFNWYLYAYGIATACLFVGARLLAPPRGEVAGVNLPPILEGLGTVLAFLLLNIQIADFFSPPGSTLTFQFSGSFARDMTYSIAWALFALVLLVVGIVKRSRAPRLAAIGLLSVTILKLFFHDLARLGQLYRIGALVGVAIIAMLASLAYQRFFTATAKTKQPENETHETIP